MTRISAKLCLAIIALATFSACVKEVGSFKSGDAPIRTSVCAVVDDARRYDGMRIAVNGCITTDGFEHVVLSGVGDVDCANGGIVPVESKRLPPHQQFRTDPRKKVCGTFTGTFRASTELYERVLAIEGTANLQSVDLVPNGR
jgi:hypothetical protein